jgi:hypothetical protein
MSMLLPVGMLLGAAGGLLAFVLNVMTMGILPSFGWRGLLTFGIVIYPLIAVVGAALCRRQGQLGMLTGMWRTELGGALMLLSIAGLGWISNVGPLNGLSAVLAMAGGVMVLLASDATKWPRGVWAEET